MGRVCLSSSERDLSGRYVIASLFLWQTYSDKLKELGLPTLQYKRLRYHMLQVSKILHGIDNITYLLRVT